MNSNPTISEASRPAYKKWLLIGIIWLIVGFVLLEVIPIVNNNSFLPGETVYNVTGDYDIRTIKGEEYMVFLTEKTVEKRKVPSVAGKNVPKGEIRCTILSGDAFLIKDGEVIKNVVYKVEDIDFDGKIIDTKTGEDISSAVEGISTISSGTAPTVWKFKKDASQYQPEENQSLWVVVQGDYHWIFEDKTLIEYYKSNELLLCQNTSSKISASYADKVYVNDYGHTVVERANTRLSLARTFGNPDVMVTFITLLILLVFFVPLVRITQIMKNQHGDYVTSLALEGNVAALKKHHARLNAARFYSYAGIVIFFAIYLIPALIAIFFNEDATQVVNTLALDNGMKVAQYDYMANNFLYRFIFHFPVINGDITDYVHLVMSLASMALVGALCWYPKIVIKSMLATTKKEMSRSSLMAKR